MKHMLAGKCSDLSKVKLPVYCSPKLDGIRATVIDGVVMSRTMKPIPNPTVQELFGKKKYNGLDGELIIGNPCDEQAFRNTTSAVMSHAHMVGKMKDLLHFHVFDDCTQPAQPFHIRDRQAIMRIRDYKNKQIVHVLSLIHI